MRRNPANHSALQLRLPLDEPPPEPVSVDVLAPVVAAVLARFAPDLELAPLRLSGRMTRTLGSYAPATRTITLSRSLLAFGGLDACRPILLHELAHAIVHHRHPKARPHGERFRSVCAELGVDPSRTVGVPATEWAARQRFIIDCNVCGGSIMRKRVALPLRCDCGAAIVPRQAARVALSADNVPRFLGRVRLAPVSARKTKSRRR